MAKLSYEDAIKLVGDAYDEIEKVKQDIVRLAIPEPKLRTARQDFTDYVTGATDGLLGIYQMLSESEQVYGGDEAEAKPAAKAPAGRGDKTKAAKNNGSSKTTVKKSTTKVAAGAQRRQRGGAKKVTPNGTKKPAADKPTASDKHRVEVPE